MEQVSYGVRGLTCSSCLAELLDAVRGVAGFADVAVELVRGGTSRLSVTAESTPGPDAVLRAVRRAGFTMAESGEKQREVRS